MPDRSAVAPPVSARFYGGLWGVLARWFVVPQESPTLPVAPGERLERFQPAPAFVRYLKLQFWLALIVVDLVLFVAWLAVLFASFWLGIALAPLFFLVAVVPDVVAYLAIHLRFDSTWYVLSDRSLRIRRGIWTIRETTITFENVQDVKVQQGPLQRYFGIADVIVHTAGGGGGQPAQQGAAPGAHVGLLEGVEDAGRIRDLIMHRVRASRSAGLGDEQPGAAPSRHVLRPAHVALLREIRDALAAATP